MMRRTNFRFRKMIPASVPAALLAAAVWGQAPDAAAHGGIWRAYDIYVEPSNADHIVLRSDVWGLIQTTDGGDSWRWICAEAYGGGSYETERRSIALLPGGTLMVANQFDGLQVARRDVCSFTEHEFFADELVQDVVLAADDGSLVYALTSTGSADGVVVKLWESTDQGMTWSEVGMQPPAGFSATSLAVAPSDPDRLYVAGKMLDDTTNITVMRSDDRGQTWQPQSLNVNDMESFSARIHGIDPADPDVIYLWKDRKEQSGEVQPDQVWASSDGGASWAMIYEGAGDLSGFEILTDQSMLLVSGPEEGIWSADINSGPPADQSAFTQVFDGKIWGLESVENGLLAGTDDYASGDSEKFSLGMSMDQGGSFEAQFEICDVSLIECPADSRTAMVCEGLVTEFQSDLQNDRCGLATGGGGADGGGSANGAVNGGSSSTANGSASGGGAGTGATATDGGADMMANGDSGGSGDDGCSVAAPNGGLSARGASGWMASALAALGAALYRRRRRRSAV